MIAAMKRRAFITLLSGVAARGVGAAAGDAEKRDARRANRRSLDQRRD